MQEKRSRKQLWLEASLSLVPTLLFIILGVILASYFGSGQQKSVHATILWLLGVLFFAIASIAFLHKISSVIKQILDRQRLGIDRAASIQFIIRVFGYILIILVTLYLLNVPLEKVLLGSALIGVILGVAAQQSLNNFFASIVLIIAKPFKVGQNITLTSGALGGVYTGKIVDLGLTHTKLMEKNGNVVLLPNATVLTSSSIRRHKTIKKIKN